MAGKELQVLSLLWDPHRGECGGKGWGIMEQKITPMEAVLGVLEPPGSPERGNL